MLNVISQGADTSAPPLLIVHGLFGSGRNWGVIARRLAEDRLVLTPDMRNHGDSPRAPVHDYPAMAADLAEVIEAHGGHADVVGHSMGGKAAMVLALTRPELVDRLIVADIAPVTYTHTQMDNIDAMRAVDLSRVSRRSDAAEQLAATISEPALRSFFTQSVDVTEKRWKLNLDVLADQMPKILSFPDIDATFDKPTLFLSGANSDYVRPEHRDAIRAHFPSARFARIPGAGHWLHAEKPREFEDSIRAFLSMTSKREA
ncbi:alpha/beta fold hydrolase [Citreimonas salinaria]|uniref:Pimeloyl-ACP methyl ester carboxylesterase n=1 Tax=Citreimonas salinaria TaxID=321339 RepID=A0A1H3JPC9_9RHOB|nr:alpha/beta fold hydrolase [Citreimonas salinaria]SDY41850.1 Pimeloyl-ACP methyl ester carboxylesterase [Citreimonas salinaria]